MAERNHRIQCYINTISSDGEVTIRGIGGFYVENRSENGTENPCNIFWKLGDDKVRGIKEVLIAEPKSTFFQMLLAAKTGCQKVELEVDSDIKNIIKVKLI